MKKYPRVPVGSIANIQSGFAFKSSRFNVNIGLPIIRIRDVTRGFSETYYNGDYQDKYLIQDGDALIGMDGEFNLAVWKGGQALLNQRVCKISVTNTSVCENYLFKYLPKALKDIEDRTPFVTVKHLSAKQIKEIQIPLPPLEEQKRIAAILDKADALRDKRRQAIAKLDELLQSVFLDMFGDPVTNPKGWERKKIKDFATVKIGPFGSLLHIEDYIVGGIPLVNPSHIIENEIKVDQNFTITKEKFEKLKQYCLMKNDIVLGRRGEIGRCAVVGEHEALLCGTGSMRIRTNDSKLSSFIQFQIANTQIKKVLERNAKGITMKNLNSGIVENLVTIFPPKSIQEKFVKFKDSIKYMQQSFHMHEKSTNNFFNSLQQRAFKGEL